MREEYSDGVEVYKKNCKCDDNGIPDQWFDLKRQQDRY